MYHWTSLTGDLVQMDAHTVYNRVQVLRNKLKSANVEGMVYPGVKEYLDHLIYIRHNPATQMLLDFSKVSFDPKNPLASLVSVDKLHAGYFRFLNERKGTTLKWTHPGKDEFQESFTCAFKVYGEVKPRYAVHWDERELHFACLELTNRNVRRIAGEYPKGSPTKDSMLKLCELLEEHTTTQKPFS
ncbi:hypothetical protein [Vibrio phage vB_VmeM-Yong XC32]|nr:hypothetical protein [Vibrio phage vB_VmeM-Yong XC31]QAX96400.1 hypothetical protein [Vibrio phage vB_VmeM-Yong XC32]QAX96717.1 hypothetical protein [Vibrio phage vB_VmeM-Yong MS31]QAX97036.1 hypothetical protein [Vibrio phage vB_VmeM-Yong MS32]